MVVLALASVLYLMDWVAPPTHFIGPGFFAVLIAPFGVALVVSGLALRYRWPGWQVLQFAPLIAIVATVIWLRSLRYP